MLQTHPYVREVHIEKAQNMSNGVEERVLVVETQLWWPSEYSVSNDYGLLDQFQAELNVLEANIRAGLLDFTRIELRPVN